MKITIGEVIDKLNNSYMSRKALNKLKSDGRKCLSNIVVNFKGNNESEFNFWVMGEGYKYIRECKQSALVQTLFVDYLIITRLEKINGVK